MQYTVQIYKQLEQDNVDPLHSIPYLLSIPQNLATMPTTNSHPHLKPKPSTSSPASHLAKHYPAMKVSMTGQPKGHLWLIFTMLFVTSAMHIEGAGNFAPPSVSVSPTDDPVIKVIGKVYCYRCFNEAHPDESHGKKHLEGAMVKVTCQANGQALVAFGYTKSNGKYSVILNGLPISNNYGADSCKVELHGAPGGSDCNVPIELNLSGLSVDSKSSEEVVFKANQIMAFASKNTFGCSKPQTQPPMHPYSSPPLPYQYPSPPAIHRSPLPYRYSPPPSNQLPPPAYQYPSPPQNYYISPPPYQQSMLPNSYQTPPPPQGTKSPVQPHKYLPPPYYYNSPPPQYQLGYVPPPLVYYPPPPYIHKPPLLPAAPYNYQSSPPPAQYSPPLPPNAPKHLHPNVPHAKSPLASPQPLYQYNTPPPPYIKSPLLPSSPAAPYYYNSPPTYQYSPPPYNYQSSPPPAHYSPPLPPNTPKHLHPNVPHAKSPPASPQPLYQYNTPPPPKDVMPSTMPPLHSYQSPPPRNQLS